MNSDLLFYVKINRETLRINFSNHLKNKLLPDILYAPSKLLHELDRNNIKELLYSYLRASIITKEVCENLFNLKK